MNHVRIVFVFCLLGLVLFGCAPSEAVVNAAAPSPVISPIMPTVGFTSTPLLTNRPLPTAISTATPIPSQAPTTAWVFQQGLITCPILLYHRIDDPPNPKRAGARYYVTPENFAAQIKALHEWGYNSISMLTLVKAIAQGAALPARPVVITFDDGYENIYKNAYPVMQAFGFTGTVYIVANRLQVAGFMNPDQLRDLSSHNWEIGVHGMSHIDLTKNHAELKREVKQARDLLESTLGISISTFAYPFAMYDKVVMFAVEDANYVAAVGVGTLYRHRKGNLYYLSRIEIRNSYDLEKLAAILPWSGKDNSEP